MRLISGLLGALVLVGVLTSTAGANPDDPHGSIVIREAETVEDVLASTDYRQTDSDILRLYQAFFARLPDVEGTRYWINVARSGRTLDAIAGWFADSAEFRQNYSTVDDRRFLEIVYGNVLGRGYDQAGFDYWLRQMQSGLSRGGVVRWVAANNEFVNRHPFTPRPGSEASRLPAGQWTVGNGPGQLAPGRYMLTAAQMFCKWERLAGLSGTPTDLLADRLFAEATPTRQIVDIRPTDAYFRFSPTCGSLRSYAPSTAATVLTSGTYLVGTDALGGTYRAEAQAGCYWERSSDFSGDLASIIDNDFAETPIFVLVTLQNGEAFRTNALCGPFTRVSS